MRKIITLDGPSGVGKTAVGLELSKNYQMEFISLGCIYRALAWCTLQKIPIAEAKKSLTFLVQKKESGESFYLPSIRGHTLDRELYTNPKLELLCSQIAQDPSNRIFVREKVHAISSSSNHGLIVEGRSAAKFFPHADCKIYLTASEKERLKRNLQESRRIGVSTEEEELANIRKKRDARDINRKKDPLRFSSEMIMWDSTYSTFEETKKQIKRWIDHYLFQKKLTLSVIIPVHNREKHLLYCLQAITSQTIPKEEYEIIVVDDGSKDQSVEVARKFATEVISISNKGPGTARNKGIERASGDILIFLDADIVVPKDYLENIRKRHSVTNSLLLLGARRHLPKGVFHPKETICRLDSREKLLRFYSSCLSHLNCPWILAYTCNFSFPRVLLKKAHFDEDLTGWGLEDIDFAYQLFHQGARFAFSKEIAAYHLYHDRSFSEDRYHSWLANLGRIMQKYSDRKIQDLTLFKDVFNPRRQASYFDRFAQFEKKAPPQSNALLCDLTLVEGDCVEFLHTQLQANDLPLILLQESSSIFNEVYLSFFDRNRIYSSIEKKDWLSVKKEIASQFAQVQKEIIHA